MSLLRNVIQFLILVIFIAPAFAGDQTPLADKRQERQERRIDQGEESGQLTDKEQKRLEKGQEHVDKVEERAKADGVVTRRERAHIQHSENVQSRRIYRAKHNRKTR